MASQMELIKIAVLIVSKTEWKRTILLHSSDPAAQQINTYVYTKALQNFLIRGYEKFRNVMIVGTAN